MISDGDLIGAQILISKFDFHGEFDIADLILRILEQNNSNMGAVKTLVKGKIELEKLLVNILV